MNSRLKSRPAIANFQQCGCINHNIFTDNGYKKFYLRSHSYFYSRREFSELLRRDLADMRVMYICTVCLDYAREKLQETRIITSNTNESNAEDDNNNNDDENNCIEDNNSSNIDVEMNNGDSLLAKMQGLTAKIKCLKWRDREDDIKFSLCDFRNPLEN